METPFLNEKYNHMTDQLFLLWKKKKLFKEELLFLLLFLFVVKLVFGEQLILFPSPPSSTRFITFMHNVTSMFNFS